MLDSQIRSRDVGVFRGVWKDVALLGVKVITIDTKKVISIRLDAPLISELAGNFGAR